MKNNFSLYAIFLVVFLSGCNHQKELLTVILKTASQIESVKTNYTVEDWGKNSKLISISITNQGTETEIIKNIEVQLTGTPLFDETSKFLYGGSCMGRSLLQQRDYNDSITTSETVFLAKNSDNTFYKVGIITWNIFQAKIAFSKSKGLIIKANGENKPIKAGETILFERFVIENGTDWQDMLFGYGEQLAKYHKITPKKIIPFKGWSTWDYYGGKFTDKEIELNTKLLKELNVDANTIQVDGGWWTSRGDYLSTKSEIEGGMKGVAKMIESYGFTPGIHIDGFRGDSNSEVFKAHPDYFIKNQDGETFATGALNANDGKGQTICFDFSNPATCEYMKNVLKTMREDWGYKYFKIDFIRYGVNEELLRYYKNNGLTAVKAYDSTMTSFERTRAGLMAMREGIGEAYFLGCSAIFGNTLGIVDGLRTGGDISPTFESYTSRCIQNGGNFYLNQTVVQNDADYLVLRNKDDEEIERAWGKDKFGGSITLNEAAMWADYVSLFGGSKFSSDNLNTLRPERKALIKKSFALTTCNRYLPIDIWDKAKDKSDAFNIMLGTNSDGVYLALFNWNNEELGIDLSNITTDKIEVVNQDEQPDFKAENNSFSIKLKARTSLIFKLSHEADFDKIRKQISYVFYK